jgi:hypothetical protein
MPPPLAPENAPAWELWAAVDTQWRSAGMGGVLGLDWPAVLQIAGLLGIDVTPPLFRKIRLLEKDALTRQMSDMEKK